MRSARLYLPVVVCLVVIAIVALTSSADGFEGLLLIAGAVLAIGVLDLFSRRGGKRPDDRGAPPGPERR